MSTQVSDRPRRVMKWLKNFDIEASKSNYIISLKNFIKCIYGKDSVSNFMGLNLGLNPITITRNKEKRISEIEDGIEKYISELDDRDFLDDLKDYAKWLKAEDYAPLTRRKNIVFVKKFFSRQDKRCKIEDDDWDDMKRTLIPKGKRPSTRDDILTKEQLTIVLQYCSIHIKSMVLFLLSTGARIGASCQLKMEDIHLYDDPPWVDIKDKYTKDEVGGRIMWFSFEARDAIISWHKDRIGRKKVGRGRGLYIEGPKAGPKDLVFNYKPVSFSTQWNKVLAKADKGQNPPVLSRRDQSTKNFVHIYHTHTLRKFFRTNMGFKGSYEGKAGVPDMIVHGMMGHKGYLEEAYSRGLERMAEIYKENMHVVTVHEVGLDEKTRAEVKKAIERADKLAKQVTVDGVYLDMVGGQLGAFKGLSEKVIEAMSGKEKWNRIINRISEVIALQKELEAFKKGELKLPEVVINQLGKLVETTQSE